MAQCGDAWPSVEMPGGFDHLFYHIKVNINITFFALERENKIGPNQIFFH